MNPKILFISHNSFSDFTNNGKTLESFFADYPKESIAQLYFKGDIEPDYNFCDNYFLISDIDAIKNIVTKKHYGNIKKENINKVISNFKTKKLTQKVFNIFSNQQFLRDLIWKISYGKNQHLFNWIDNFNPTIIFFHAAYSGFAHSIVAEIKKRYDIPLIVYFTDDYLLSPCSKNPLELIQKKRIQKFYQKSIQSASVCIAIGDCMAKDYSDYFNRKFYALMNSIEIKKPLSLHKTKDITTIRYFGGLHLNRWKMICRLSEIIKSIHKHIEIEVYTTSFVSKNIKNKFIENFISLKEPLLGTELEDKISCSDLLLHIESDEKYYRSLTKLSISTKIPEYLISGSCILAFGPTEVASIKLLKDNQIGFVIGSEESDNTIKEKLIEIITNSELRYSISTSGYNYAIKKFDAKKNRIFLTEKIEKAINSYKTKNV